MKGRGLRASGEAQGAVPRAKTKNQKKHLPDSVRLDLNADRPKLRVTGQPAFVDHQLPSIECQLPAPNTILPPKMPKRNKQKTPLRSPLWPFQSPARKR